MASGKLVYNFLKGELFRLARIQKPSHEFRDVLRSLHPGCKELFGTMPAEITHRFNILTKIARVHSGCREAIVDTCWELNIAYGRGAWKGDRQPVLDHLHEIWAAGKDVRMVAWASLLSRMHGWGNEMYTETQCNKGFSLLNARRQGREWQRTLLDFDLRFDEIFEDEIKSITAIGAAAVENGEIVRMSQATVQALRALQNQKANAAKRGSDTIANGGGAVVDNAEQDDAEDTIDPSLCEDIAVDCTEYENVGVDVVDSTLCEEDLTEEEDEPLEAQV
ncbi:hypothetical protein CYMTET_56574, partial [Cymbomonas tetramitiformis]